MKKGFKNMLCSSNDSNHQTPPTTLEQMIMQLDLDASRPPAALHNRMSCVNSSDILRSARHALTQYPRFSLDGKDAMYRSSFRNFDHDHDRVITTRPSKVAGERVIWCTPGVVGKLMGLDAMPIPVRLKHRMMVNTCLLTNHNLSRGAERQAAERRKVDSGRDSCSQATTSKGSLHYHFP